MTELDPQGDYERHLAEAIDDHARDIDRVCEARLKKLTAGLSTEQAPYPRAHLISLRRPIHFLALQAINPTGHPSAHPQQGGLTEPWRFRLQRYFAAVEAINTAIEQAVQSGALAIRESSTGLQVQTLPQRAAAPATPFAAAIFNAMPSRVFREAAELLLSLPLLDHLPHEGVAVRLQDFDEWTARAGIAESGEVTRLLQDADDRMWQKELLLHAQLARLAQDEQKEAELRASGLETAAEELSRLQAIALARGRIIENTASGPAPAPTAEASQPSANAEDDGGWLVQVREIADELDLRDAAAGAWSSNKDISERIAPIAIERGIKGPHGQLTASNILRMALQGGRWTRPRKGPTS